MRETETYAVELTAEERRVLIQATRLLIRLRDMTHADDRPRVDGAAAGLEEIVFRLRPAGREEMTDA